MNNIRKEIRDLITINEKIQSALLNGDRLTDDEAILTRQCATELLENIATPTVYRQTVQPMDGHQAVTKREL